MTVEYQDEMPQSPRPYTVEGLAQDIIYQEQVDKDNKPKEGTHYGTTLWQGVATLYLL